MPSTAQCKVFVWTACCGQHVPYSTLLTELVVYVVLRPDDLTCSSASRKRLSWCTPSLLSSAWSSLQHAQQRHLRTDYQKQHALLVLVPFQRGTGMFSAGDLSCRSILLSPCKPCKSHVELETRFWDGPHQYLLPLQLCLQLLYVLHLTAHHSLPELVVAAEGGLTSQTHATGGHRPAQGMSSIEGMLCSSIMSLKAGSLLMHVRHV